MDAIIIAKIICIDAFSSVLFFQLDYNKVTLRLVGDDEYDDEDFLMTMERIVVCLF